MNGRDALHWLPALAGLCGVGALAVAVYLALSRWRATDDRVCYLEGPFEDAFRAQPCAEQALASPVPSLVIGALLTSAGAAALLERRVKRIAPKRS